MKINVLAFLALLASLLFACEQNQISADQEQIDAIEAATNKSEVSLEQMPDEAIAALESEYENEYSEKAELSPDLGYSVYLNGMGFSWEDGSNKAYFNLNGRQLNQGRSGRNALRRATIVLSNRCFSLIFPVSYVMPDGTIITGNDQASLNAALRAWYAANPNANGAPSVQFPLQVQYNNRRDTLTINNTRELRRLYQSCYFMVNRFDCPRQGANYGDRCRDASGNVGRIDRNCNCDTSSTYDCPRINANFGDPCRLSNGTSGTIDRNCNCS